MKTQNEKSISALFLVLFLLTPIIVLGGCDFIFFNDVDEDYNPGQKSSFEINKDLSFNMRLAPPKTFPTGRDHTDATVNNYYLIGETQVTYELWYAVKTKAEDMGYNFANPGKAGSHGDVGLEPSAYKYHPVTSVNYYDCVVFCNALSELLGFEASYTYQGKIIKDASDQTAINNMNIEENIGFRLPTSDEWELAARYQGEDSSFNAIEYPANSNNFWTRWEYASGAENNVYNHAATTAAAWYNENSTGTREVGQKPSNGNTLGLFDMSGNVFEWCVEWYPTYEGTHRINRGGSWSYNNLHLRVGAVNCALAYSVSISHGFRLAKSHITY